MLTLRFISCVNTVNYAILARASQRAISGDQCAFFAPVQIGQQNPRHCGRKTRIVYLINRARNKNNHAHKKTSSLGVYLRLRALANRAFAKQRDIKIILQITG